MLRERPVSDLFANGSAIAADHGETFRIEEERPARAGVVLFVLYGEVDLHVAPELRSRLTAAIEEGADYVVIDLSRVTFLDSMALGILLGALKRLRPVGGELRLVVPNTDLRRIFEITLLDQVFTIHATRHEALAPFLKPWSA
jgi:anti-sigma B factor antagonist